MEFSPASKQWIPPAAILGLSLIVAALIAAYAFYNVHTLNNTLSVTGSATEETKADSGKLTVSVSRLVFEDGIAYAETKVASDANATSAFFVKSGIDKEKVGISPVYVDQEYTSDNNAPRRYNVHGQVTIISDDPSLIEKISKNISTLSNQGIVVSTQAPEYFVSTLPNMRIALIGKAIEDAKRRAEAIAKATGRGVGSLQSAASGVVQVLAPNSVDVADYGSYDTSTIDKTVMVTARATFYLR